VAFFIITVVVTMTVAFFCNLLEACLMSLSLADIAKISERQQLAGTYMEELPRQHPEADRDHPCDQYACHDHGRGPFRIAIQQSVRREMDRPLLGALCPGDESSGPKFCPRRSATGTTNWWRRYSGSLLRGSWSEWRPFVGNAVLHQALSGKEQGLGRRRARRHQRAHAVRGAQQSYQ